jgi:hypothetical protein
VQWCQHDRPRVAQQQHALTWQKPSWGWHKCNVDAGFFDGLNRTNGVYVIVQRVLWWLELCVMKWNEGKCSTTKGESIALLEAMREMERLMSCLSWIRRLCLMLFICHVMESPGLVHLFVRSRMFCCQINPNFVVKFVKWQTNMIAHTFARATISRSRRDVIEVLSLYIATLLHNEINF